ncbi:MAG: hypothetical protein Hens3KO_08940 [Henriciella sp.]
MPDLTFATPLIDLFNKFVAGSPIWAGIGLAATIVAAMVILWISLRLILGVFGSFAALLARRKRRQTPGYVLGVARFNGGRGKATTKALITTLKNDLNLFSFGAQFEVIEAPTPKATKRLGLRDVARGWLKKASGDLIVWGHRDSGPKAGFLIDILSCEGSLTPAEATQTRVQLPRDYAKSTPLVRRAGAYLVARALLPGLSRGTAFKPEKLLPVADFLAELLTEPGSLSEQTIGLLETDYCAMALHIGTDEHLHRIVTLRRQRLLAERPLETETLIAARIDLGSALLALAGQNFDPTQVREAMDHLKIAIDLLRENPTIQLAGQTSNAVQQGQAMLQARQRFSVTGGSGI